MASLLRQIVAGPRAKHEESGLDLCYVTSNIIATSGPSQSYPKRAYRNPLDRLVAFLDSQHGDDWAIWEFRGEGTGYPDEAVYGRIRHYPWPDHHPPPFRLVPMIMASMRNWLAGGELHGRGQGSSAGNQAEPKRQGVEDKKLPEKGSRQQTQAADGPIQDRQTAEAEEDKQQTTESVKGGTKNNRVVVVHCKAGKGRSGSMACSFLISERGWKPEDALARFTERRMRPKFGAGISIPSQLRWISYVDRWTKGGKRYVERAIEIVEIHMWGLRNGVKVSVEGFVDEGRRIKVLHTFSRDERLIVEGDTPSAGTVATAAPDLAALAAAAASSGVVAEDDVGYEDVKGTPPDSGSESPRSQSVKPSRKSHLIRKISRRSNQSPARSQDGQSGSGASSNEAAAIKQSPSAPLLTALPTQTPPSTIPKPSATAAMSAPTDPGEKEPGGMAVIFKPREPLRISNSDVNIAVERRNRAPAAMGLTMVTAVAHVWFNVFFEGRGPEQDGRADGSGVFEIEWDKMDGIKGSSQKGTRAMDRMAVVWRAVDSSSSSEAGGDDAEAPAKASLGGVGADIPTKEKASSRRDETGAYRTGAGDTGAAVAPAAGTDHGVVPTLVHRRATEIREPGVGEEVPEMQAADWKGGNAEDPEAGRKLGLRVEDPDSTGVSKASSVKSQDSSFGADASGRGGKQEEQDSDSDSLTGVKTSGPAGEDLDPVSRQQSPQATDSSSSGDGSGKAGKVAAASKGEAGQGDRSADPADSIAQKGFIVE